MLPSGVAEKTQKARLRKLATTADRGAFVSAEQKKTDHDHHNGKGNPKPTVKKKPKFDLDNLGVDPKVAGITYGKKVGGVRISYPFK
jgi:hypothetical protein